MKKLLFLLAILAVFQTSIAQDQPHHGNIMDWMKLVDNKDKAGAEKLCSAFVNSSELIEQAEAQKCLMNVALMGNEITLLEGNDAGGGELRGSYKPEAVDEALKHLNRGIQIAPQDLSIHQGRLYILEVSGRYDEMIKELDESASIYKGPDAFQAWLAYAPELHQAGQYKAGLKFMQMLDKHYPNNSDVLGNIGAFYSALKQFDKAIEYLQKAQAMAPEDSINAWDLGEAYGRNNQIELADKWLQKGMSLEQNKERLADQSCLYAVFVEEKLKDRPRACELEKKSCDLDRQTACEAAKPEVKK